MSSFSLDLSKGSTPAAPSNTMKDATTEEIDCSLLDEPDSDVEQGTGNAGGPSLTSTADLTKDLGAVGSLISPPVDVIPPPPPIFAARKKIHAVRVSSSHI